MSAYEFVAALRSSANVTMVPLAEMKHKRNKKSQPTTFSRIYKCFLLRSFGKMILKCARHLTSVAPMFIWKLRNAICI